MKKYNLLLPIAGKAQRFIDAGYTMPKPLIMAQDKQIIDWSMSSIDTSECNIIFVVRKEHINNFSIDDILKNKFGKDIKIISIDHVTRGSVETCLYAKKFIDNSLPLFIYTPDVFFEPVFKPESVSQDLDGCVLTFKANSAAHSYVELNQDGLAVKTAEKEVISSNAAVGVYYFKKGSDFVRNAEEMIKLDLRTKNEFYICPLYNLMIKSGDKVGIIEAEKMHVLGTPEELDFFVKYVAPKFGDKPVALSCDHSGFEMKESFKKILTKHNIRYIDFGTHINKACDYNDYVHQAAESIREKICDFGLAFCRTGQGVNILANKYKHIRSALVFDEYTAEYSIRHIFANIL
jgi:RpiB/LacA/LacB family sugar-phosphate isomerase